MEAMWRVACQIGRTTFKSQVIHQLSLLQIIIANFQNNLAGCDSAGPRLCPERWSPPVSPAPHHRPGLGGHEVGQSEAVSGTVSLPQKH